MLPAPLSQEARSASLGRRNCGEIEVRGRVTGSYYKDDSQTNSMMVAHRRCRQRRSTPVHSNHRSRQDVIKSGGEWVSSVELENQIMGHPDVIEAAVIAVPDERWDERPLACVVIKEGSTTTLHDLQIFLAHRVVRWWLPERWAIIEEVPKTSVGKFDKKVLRARYAHGDLRVVSVQK